jgi:hypothetical protein
MERKILPRRAGHVRKAATSRRRSDCRAPRERAAALPMAEARMPHTRPGARRRTPCGRCAVVVLQMKAASALSEEAGLPGRETVCA